MQAGSDIADGDEYADSLLTAVAAGNLTVGEVQQRLYYTMLIRMRLGLFDPPAGQAYLSYGVADVGAPSTRAAALLAAKESLVLLQNSRKTLPFVGASAAPVVVVGFAANSTQALISNYVSQVCPAGGALCFRSIATAINALGATVTVAPGCSNAKTCPPALVSAAVAAVQVPGVRVVLVLGLDQSLEREQLDRQNLTLPEDQEAMAESVLAAAGAAGNAVAIVLVHGGALSIPSIIANGASILDAFYPGPFGGDAIAATLWGEYNPGGKLPYSVYDTYAPDMVDMRVAAVGRTYRYSHVPGAPQAVFPFGFGLSYTTFALSYDGGAPPSNLTLTPADPTASVVLRLDNTGSQDGDEVLQAYFVPIRVDAPEPPFLPRRQLFAFSRVHIPKGGSVSVKVDVPSSQMKLTLADGTREPIDGEYLIVFSRGEGVGPELALGCTIKGF